MQHSNFSTSGTCKYFCLIQEYRLLIITNTEKKKKENQQISFSRTVYWTAYLTTLIQLTKCYQCDQLVCVCVFLLQQSPHRASFRGQSAWGGRMVLTGYVTHDFVVMHHKHCLKKMCTMSLLVKQKNKKGGMQANYRKLPFLGCV